MWQTVNRAKIRLYGCVTPDKTEVLPYEIVKDTLIKVQKGQLVQQKQFALMIKWHILWKKVKFA